MGDEKNIKPVVKPALQDEKPILDSPSEGGLVRIGNRELVKRESVETAVRSAKRFVVDKVAPTTASVFHRPDVKAALIIGPAIMIIGLFNVMTGFVGTFVTAFVRVGFYVLQGYLVAKFASQASDCDQPRLTRYAINSALLTWLVSAIWVLLCLAALGVMTAGIAFAAIPVYFANHAINIIVNIAVTLVSAKLAMKYGGGRMVASLGAVALAGMFLTALIGVCAIGLLLALGFALFGAI